MGIAAVVGVKLKSLLSEEGHDLCPSRRATMIERAAIIQLEGWRARSNTVAGLSPDAFQLALGGIRVKANARRKDVAVASELVAIQGVEIAAYVNKDACPRHLDNPMGRPTVLCAETVGGKAVDPAQILKLRLRASGVTPYPAKHQPVPLCAPQTHATN
ncbi:MAG: hypothetical protein ACM3L9_06890 [Deltaproteobacteria bacterium]